MSAKMMAQDDDKTPSERDTAVSSSQSQLPTNTHNNEEEDTNNLLSQLRLPRMHVNNNNDDQAKMNPSLRILVVANVDLNSAAALAEHALQQQSELGGGNVDCIIACGPFCNDIRNKYLQGSARRNKSTQPYERSREETAALEGLVSATLAQLESIVCRIVYVPHPTDPSTLLLQTSSEQQQEHLRLTPNSINIHSTWQSLAPGIGCCGYAGITSQQRQDLVGIERVRVQHGLEYEEALQQVLQLAPPSNPSSSSKYDTTMRRDSDNKINFDSPNMQAILVTQVDADKNVSPKHANDDTFEWPKHYSYFMDSSVCQSNVLLNIASAPPSYPPFSQVRGETFLVSPGSLQTNGHYCLVDIGVHACCDNNGGDSSNRTFEWRVDDVQFRNMHNND